MTINDALTSDMSRAEMAERDEADARLWSEERPWPVKMLAWLLMLQGVGLILMGLLGIDFSLGWRIILEDEAFYVTLPPLGLLAGIAASGFYRVQPGAWVMAMLLQGLTLLIALVFYFLGTEVRPFLYGMMFYGIAMVLYLNYAEIPALFRVQPGTSPQLAGEDIAAEQMGAMDARLLAGMVDGEAEAGEQGE